MTPYAHYAAQLQPGDIPLSVILFPVVHPITQEGRVEKQDMGEERNYPKNRRARYVPRDRAAEQTKRMKKMAADLRENTYSFMHGKGWLTIRTMADLRGVDETSVSRSMGYLVDDKVVQKKMLGKTAMFRWIKK